MTPHLQFTLNTSKDVVVNVTDPDKDNVTLKFNGTAPPGFQLTDTTLKWTPANTAPYKFTFIAADSKQAESIYQPQVRLCQCQNGGTCSFTHLDGNDAPTNPGTHMV